MIEDGWYKVTDTDGHVSVHQVVSGAVGFPQGVPMRQLIERGRTFERVYILNRADYSRYVEGFSVGPPVLNSAVRQAVALERIATAMEERNAKQPEIGAEHLNALRVVWDYAYGVGDRSMDQIDDELALAREVIDYFEARQVNK